MPHCHIPWKANLYAQWFPSLNIWECNKCIWEQSIKKCFQRAQISQGTIELFDKDASNNWESHSSHKLLYPLEGKRCSKHTAK